MTMRSNTRAVTIPASVEEVFSFLGDPGNLPRWAVGYARGIRRDGDESARANPSGRARLRGL